jgi:hypothetical protein
MGNYFFTAFPQNQPNITGIICKFVRIDFSMAVKKPTSPKVPNFKVADPQKQR